MRVHLVDLAEAGSGAAATARRDRRDGFVAGLERAGHDVFVTTLDSDEFGSDEFGSKELAAQSPLECFEGVDVVHAWSVAALAIAPRGPALVVSPRVSVSRVAGQSVVHVERGAAQALAKTTARIRTFVVPSVEAGSAWAPSLSSVPIVTVPTGVDTSLFTPDGPSAPAREGQLRILAVGTPGASHGFLDAVRAARHFASVDLVFTGGPGVDLAATQDARETYALACSLGMGDQVSFARPFGDDLTAQVLRSADVILDVAGDDVTHCLVLQSMAVGKPVIASDMGAFADIVVDEVTGLTVPHGNEGKLRAALRRLVDDAFFRDSLGLAGRDRAVSRFDWTRVTSEMVRVYERSVVAAAPLVRSTAGGAEAAVATAPARLAALET